MEDGGVVIGLGFRPAATPAEVSAALASALADARCAWSEVVAIATLESRRGHPALGWLAARNELSPAEAGDVQGELRAAGDRIVPVRFFSAAALAGVRTPNPAAGVARAVGTASVAEAAALVSSGARALLVPKRCTPRVCTAVARISSVTAEDMLSGDAGAANA
jgi:cobalamin biosynthesis protein CbiG